MPRVANLQDALDEVENYKDEAVEVIRQVINSLSCLDNSEDMSDVLHGINDAVDSLHNVIGILE